MSTDLWNLLVNLPAQRGGAAPEVPILYWIVLVIAVIVALFFCVLVFFTGKGDAMSGGGGGIRTTFKGRATFDDQVARLTLILGGGFMALMILLDVMAARLAR
jgi:preprotein translocase subunit SecG